MTVAAAHTHIPRKWGPAWLTRCRTWRVFSLHFTPLPQTPFSIALPLQGQGASCELIGLCTPDTTHKNLTNSVQSQPVSVHGEWDKFLPGCLSAEEPWVQVYATSLASGFSSAALLIGYRACWKARTGFNLRFHELGNFETFWAFPRLNADEYSHWTLKDLYAFFPLRILQKSGKEAGSTWEES